MCEWEWRRKTRKRSDVAIRSYPKLREPRRPRVKFQVGATWHGTVEPSLSSSIFLFRFGSVGFWIFILVTFVRLVVSRAYQKWDPSPVLRRRCHCHHHHHHHHHPSPTTPHSFTNPSSIPSFLFFLCSLFLSFQSRFSSTLSLTVHYPYSLTRN